MPASVVSCNENPTVQDPARAAQWSGVLSTPDKDQYFICDMSVSYGTGETQFCFAFNTETRKIDFNLAMETADGRACIPT